MSLIGQVVTSKPSEWLPVSDVTRFVRAFYLLAVLLNFHI